MRRLVALAVLAAIPVVTSTALTAGNVVPATSLLFRSTAIVKTTAFRPGECGGTYTTFYAGGTNTGTNGADLMLGSGGADTIRGSNGDDCIVSGGGLDIVNGGSGTDVCVVGNATPALNISGCESVVRRP